MDGQKRSNEVLVYLVLYVAQSQYPNCRLGVI